MVIKVCNTDSRGRPDLLFRTLKDVYESEDARRLGRSSKSVLNLMSAGSVSYNGQVKNETLCLPRVDRTLKEVKFEIDESVLADGDDVIDSDMDDNTTLKQLRERSKTKILKEVKLEFDDSVRGGDSDDTDGDLDHDITLKQLRERSRTRKRKLGSGTSENSNKADTNRKQVEEECDIDEPLSVWKSKNSKARRICTNRNDVSCLKTSFSIKSEENQFFDGSTQVAPKSPPVIHVTAEVPEHEPQACQPPTYFADELSTNLNEESDLGVAASNAVSRRECDREASFFADEWHNCVTNEISYDQLEGAETEKDGMQVLPCRSSPDKIQSSSTVEEISGQSSGISSSQVDNTAVDNNIACTEPCNGVNIFLSEDETKNGLLFKKDGSLSSPIKSCSSAGNSIISLEINDNSVPSNDAMANKEEVLTFTYDSMARNGLNSEHQLEDDLSMSKEQQTLASTGTYGERKTSLENQSCDIPNTVEAPELYQPPRRLLSTRREISPSSQQKLCLHMNSVQLRDGIELCDCQGKLWLEKQHETKVSPSKSDCIDHAKIAESMGELAAESQRKVLNSGQILRKVQNLKASLPKGNLEGPRFSRTLPNFSTGCTSTKGFSESAIAFSQRQMHDMESIAMKLMNELKCMKDIVEEKVLFEAYRNTSFRKDADEVKVAISNAAKVEETAKKWLSMMTRDCTRFCKIMKLTQNSATTSTNAAQKERKKIVFADEAGGKLCHVRFFEDCTTSPASVSPKQ